jgi:hypothetical protein
MEVNTSDRWKSLLHGSKGPPSAWRNVQPTGNRHGRATPRCPSHNGGWSDTKGQNPRVSGLTFRPIGPNQVGGNPNRRCKKEYWAFDQKSVDREAGRPDIFVPRAQLHVEVTSTDVHAYKPRIGSSTDLQSNINSSPHLTSKARRIEASPRRSVALHISLENKERGEVRVRRGVKVSAPFQLCASEERSSSSSNFFFFRQ